MFQRSVAHSACFILERVFAGPRLQRRNGGLGDTVQNKLRMEKLAGRPRVGDQLLGMEVDMPWAVVGCASSKSKAAAANVTTCSSVTWGASTSNSESNAWLSLLTKDWTDANMSSSCFAKVCRKTIAKKKPTVPGRLENQAQEETFQSKTRDVELSAMMEKGNEGGLSDREDFSETSSPPGCTVCRGRQTQIHWGRSAEVGPALAGPGAIP